MKFAYEDILHLPRHVSEKRARMSPMDRAAQFSPFAALTGFDEAVAETARLTCERIELDEDARMEVDMALQELLRRLPEGPRAAITHFVPDEKKFGGQYVVTEGRVRRVSGQERYLLMEEGRVLFFEDILTLRLLEE